MLKRALSTVWMFAAAMLATPAAVDAQGTSVAQSQKAAAAQVVRSGRINVDGIHDLPHHEGYPAAFGGTDETVGW